MRKLIKRTCCLDPELHETKSVANTSSYKGLLPEYNSHGRHSSLLELQHEWPHIFSFYSNVHLVHFSSALNLRSTIAKVQQPLCHPLYVLRLLGGAGLPVHRCARDLGERLSDAFDCLMFPSNSTGPCNSQ